MPLNFDLEKVQERDELWVKGESGYFLHGKWDAIVQLTMPLGMPRITEENADEFFRRVRAYEEVIGLVMPTAHGPVAATLDDVKRLIGLRTNATPISKRDFARKISEEREMKAEYERRAGL